MWFVAKISIPVVLEGLLGKLHVFSAIPCFLNYLKNGLCQLHLLVFGCDFVIYL